MRVQISHLLHERPHLVGAANTHQLEKNITGEDEEGIEDSLL